MFHVLIQCGRSFNRLPFIHDGLTHQNTYTHTLSLYPLSTFDQIYIDSVFHFEMSRKLRETVIFRMEKCANFVELDNFCKMFKHLCGWRNRYSRKRTVKNLQLWRTCWAKQIRRGPADATSTAAGFSPTERRSWIMLYRSGTPCLLQNRGLPANSFVVCIWKEQQGNARSWLQ